jgi:hypothetical protein
MVHPRGGGRTEIVHEDHEQDRQSTQGVDRAEAASSRRRVSREFQALVDPQVIRGGVTR